MILSSARARILTPALASALVLVSVAQRRVTAQDSVDPIKKNAQGTAQPATKDDESSIRLQQMTEIAHGFKFVTVDGATRIPAELVPNPLHRWTDPTRPFSGGALWVSKSHGRPVAILAIELYAAWSLEFVSLSTGLVEAQDGQVRWRPQKAGVEFREIAGAPVPADDQPKRLRQMRELARRISAREFYDNQHYALRLLPQPIDRYADPASGAIDGAVFIYAHGTNPEILLLIEARRQGSGPPAWTFAAAPLTRAQPTLKLDGKDIWTSPTKENTTPEQPYYDVFKGRGSRAVRRVQPQKEGL
jgi:hypothetical protein